ncbi:hypothetical protein NPX13_g8844 [Xylaria arbuscula]|uniref:Uncharacterized protein n=1 Tax=Xylaria arbuscula TaxID=114810 RepID=A0A9W8N7X5_9PEZI|nr:hypothetical protein NPX13_g8844 [Xylaria arbuscula]
MRFVGMVDATVDRDAGGRGMGWKEVRRLHYFLELLPVLYPLGPVQGDGDGVNSEASVTAINNPPYYSTKAAYKPAYYNMPTGSARVRRDAEAGGLGEGKRVASSSRRRVSIVHTWNICYTCSIMQQQQSDNAATATWQGSRNVTVSSLISVKWLEMMPVETEKPAMCAETTVV